MFDVRFSKYYSDPGRKFIYTAKHLNTGTYEWKFNWNTPISNYSSNIRRIEKIKISVRDTRTTSPVFIRSISVRLSLMSAWFNKWRINKTCQFEQNWHFRRQIYQVNISGLRGWLSIATANYVRIYWNVLLNISSKCSIVRNVAYTLFQFFVWNSFVREYSWLTMLIIRGYMLKTFEDKWTKKKDESKHVIEGYPQFSAGDHRGVIWLRKSIKSEELQFSLKSLNHLLIGSLVDKILCFLDKNYWVIFRLKVLNLNFLLNFVLLRWQLWQ